VLQQGVAALDDLSVAHDSIFAVAAGLGGEPQVTAGFVVSGNYFDVLGVQPALGRFFVPDEDAVPWARPAVVVSHAYWQRHLSGHPAVLHRTLAVNGVDLPSVGIAPEGFVGVHTRADVQLWVTSRCPTWCSVTRREVRSRRAAHRRSPPPSSGG